MRTLLVLTYTGLVALFVVLTTTTILAQTKNRHDSTVVRPYWEVGADLLWLINKNRVPENTVFIRRNQPKGHGKSTALRFRLGVDTDYELTRVGIDDFLYDSFFVYSPYLSIGYQIGKSKGRYEYFYGADLAGWGSRKKQYYYSSADAVTTWWVDRDIWNYNIAAHLFCGFKWKLTKGLSVSVESHLMGIYNRYRHWVETGPVGFGPVGFTDDRERNFTTRIKPMQVVNLTYNLTKSQ